MASLGTPKLLLSMLAAFSWRVIAATSALARVSAGSELSHQVALAPRSAHVGSVSTATQTGFDSKMLPQQPPLCDLNDEFCSVQRLELLRIAGEAHGITSRLGPIV